jgi:hypothetical protein
VGSCVGAWRPARLVLVRVPRRGDGSYGARGVLCFRASPASEASSWETSCAGSRSPASW